MKEEKPKAYVITCDELEEALRLFRLYRICPVTADQLEVNVRSRPLSEEILKARKDVLDELIEHYERVIKDGSGITYNHPITYKWMYRGIVVDYLKLLREGAL
jgi:predicted DNA-binding protein (UPF0251 family)